MRIKTNAKCQGCRKAILDAVTKRFPDAQWDLELESADRILEAHGIPEDAETAAQVVKTVEETGFKGTWLPSDKH